MKNNIYCIVAITALLIATGLPVNAQVTPNDPDFGSHQEYLRVVKADEAWSVTTGDPNENISIIGLGGVQVTHEDLQYRPSNINTTFVRDGGVNDPRSFVNMTPIAGIIGAHTNNSVGIAGVNWQSPLTVHDIAKNGTVEQGGGLVLERSVVDDRLTTASYNNNSRLIYMPFNWSGGSEPIEIDPVGVDFPFNEEEFAEGFRSFIANTILGAARSMLQAPGVDWNNALQAAKSTYLNGSVIVTKMADYDGVFTGFPASMGAERISISVGALDEEFNEHYPFSSEPRADRARAGFSDIDVSAPGQKVYTTVLDEGSAPYKELTGTAYAGSIVTGGVSLMQDVNSNLEPDDVKEILRRTSFDVGAPGYDPAPALAAWILKKRWIMPATEPLQEALRK